MRGGAHLADRAGGGFDRIKPHGLDGIDDRQAGAFGIQRRQNVAQVGFGPQGHRRIGQPQALGAHADLRRRLFARDIEAFHAVAGKGGCGLQEKRRFANARITADQNGTGRHQPAAKHAVKLLDPGRGARGRGLFGRQIGQGNGAALGTKRLWPGREGGLLDNRIPSATRITAPGPFAMGSAAGRTGERLGRFAHTSCCLETRPSSSPYGHSSEERHRLRAKSAVRLDEPPRKVRDATARARPECSR